MRDRASPGVLLMAKRILIVDDSPTIRRMVAASFVSAAGVETAEAASGLHAIEVLTTSPVHLMILDLNMPDMHGVEVLRFVRAHDRYRALPIIVLTTRGDDDSRASALREGATRYLTKPFVPGVLAAEAAALLGAAAPEPERGRV